MGADPVYVQNSFRIRTGDTVGLNTDSGWAALENIDATIDAGQVFRIRFHISETAGKGSSQGFKLQANHESGGWNTLLVDNGVAVYPGIPRASSQFTDGDATTELLTNQGASFVGGQGDTDNSATANPDSSETELEYAILIPGSYGGGTFIADAYTIQFRVVEADETAFTTYSQTPTVTVNRPVGYLGGVAVEVPWAVGPFVDTNGNLYQFIEYDESSGAVGMYKSTDGGDAWAPVDTTGEPTSGDSESANVVQVGESLHIFHYGTNPRYHRFDTSDHGTPDNWGVIDETIASVSYDKQSGSLAVRSDGTIVACFQYTDTTEKVGYRVRSAGGVWDIATTVIDDSGGAAYAGPTCIREVGSDIVHIFYKDFTNGDVYHKSLNESDVLSARELVEGDGGTAGRYTYTNPIAWQDGADEKIMIGVWDDSDEFVYSVTITNDGTPAARKQASGAAVQAGAAGSSKVQACLANDGANIYLLYGQAADDDLYLNTNVNDGAWGTAVEQSDAVNVDNIYADVFVHSTGNGGAKVLAWVFDDGGNGYTGNVWYDELFLAHAAIISESLTVSESVTVSVGAAPPVDPKPDIQDDVTATDSVALDVSDPQVSAQSDATITDSVTVSVEAPTALAPSVQDDATITDSAAAIVSALLSAVQDDAIAADSVGVVVSDLSVSVQSDATATDDATAAVILAATLSVEAQDDATATDTTTAEVSAPQVTNQDDATATDSAAAAVGAPQATLTDDAIATDAAAAAVSAPQAGAQSDATATDSATVSVVTGPSDLSVNISDNMTAASYLWFYDSQITATDSITAQVAAVGAISVSVSDDATLTDSVSVVIDLAAPVSDDATVTDSAAADVSDPQAVISDAATVSDSVTLSIPAAGDEAVSLQDDATVSDSAAAEVSAPPVSVQDDATISDSVTANIATGATAQDDATVTDSVTVVVGGLVASLTDDATISDTVTVSVSSAVARSVNVTDNLTVTDSATIEQQFLIVTSDDLAVADSVTVVLPDALGVGITDNATIAELVDLALPVSVLLDVDLTDAIVYSVVLGDAAQYGVTLSDGAEYGVTLDDAEVYGTSTDDAEVYGTALTDVSRTSP